MVVLWLISECVMADKWQYLRNQDGTKTEPRPNQKRDRSII